MKLLREYIRTLLTGQDQSLEQIVSQFREEMEAKYDWKNTKGCFSGKCWKMTTPLVQRLNQAGISAREKEGMYYGASDEYVSIEPENYGDGEYPHWWVETDTNIIDVTADQFHPGREDQYRVVITDKRDPDYS